MWRCDQVNSTRKCCLVLESCHQKYASNIILKCWVSVYSLANSGPESLGDPYHMEGDVSNSDIFFETHLTSNTESVVQCICNGSNRHQGLWDRIRWTLNLFWQISEMGIYTSMQDWANCGGEDPREAFSISYPSYGANTLYLMLRIQK